LEETVDILASTGFREAEPGAARSRARAWERERKMAQRRGPVESSMDGTYCGIVPTSNAGTGSPPP